MPKNKGGRPTKYKPEYCKKVVEFMAKGYSKEAFAGHIRVSGQRIYDWSDKHKEFREAVKKAEVVCREWWEKIGKEGMTGKIKGFNSAIWIFNMKNRFHWRDVRETEITGKAGEEFTVKVIEDKEEQKALKKK